VVVLIVHPLIVLHCSHATIVGVTGKFCLICLVCVRAYIGTLPTLSPFRDLPPSLCSWPSIIVTFKLILLSLFLYLSLSLSLSLSTELPPSLPIRCFILTFKEYVPFNLLLFLVNEVLSMWAKGGIAKRRENLCVCVCVCVLPHCERRDKVHGCTFYWSERYFQPHNWKGRQITQTSPSDLSLGLPVLFSHNLVY
jgi:hypothetical protein